MAALVEGHLSCTIDVLLYCSNAAVFMCYCRVTLWLIHMGRLLPVCVPFLLPVEIFLWRQLERLRLESSQNNLDAPKKHHTQVKSGRTKKQFLGLNIILIGLLVFLERYEYSIRINHYTRIIRVIHTYGVFL